MSMVTCAWPLWDGTGLWSPWGEWKRTNSRADKGEKCENRISYFSLTVNISNWAQRWCKRTACETHCPSVLQRTIRNDSLDEKSTIKVGITARVHYICYLTVSPRSLARCDSHPLHCTSERSLLGSSGSSTGVRCLVGPQEIYVDLKINKLVDAMILVFWMLSFKSAFSLSCFTFIKRLFSSSSLSAIKVMSFAYLRLLIFLLAILIPACASSSLAFFMMYSAYKLNKQGDIIQPWCTPFPILNQSVVWCKFFLLDLHRGFSGVR